MNEANTKKLYKDFPKLYRGRKRTLQESLMPFGFMCGDGWFKIVYDLSKKITKIDPNCEAVEVKEKWGGLRFYVNPTKREVFDAIDKAEERSFHTCEECGKEGKFREDIPWVLTLCDKCYEPYKLENKIKKFGETHGRKAPTHMTFKIRRSV
jgi:hypothetical protein